MRHLSVLTSAVLLAAIPSAAGGTAAAQREYWGNFERYAADNARVAALPLSERRVVFMGNSITDFWPGNHPSFFADNHFIGRGISGQSTYQFLSRFRDDVINLRPELVVLNAACSRFLLESLYYRRSRANLRTQPPHTGLRRKQFYPLCRLLHSHGTRRRPRPQP